MWMQRQPPPQEPVKSLYKGPQMPLGSQEPIFIPVTTLESFLEPSEAAGGCAGRKGLALRHTDPCLEPRPSPGAGVSLTNGATGHAGQDAERGRAVIRDTLGPQEGLVATAYKAERHVQKFWRACWSAIFPTSPPPTPAYRLLGRPSQEVGEARTPRHHTGRPGRLT